MMPKLYLATSLAIASLSTQLAGCGAAVDAPAAETEDVSSASAPLGDACKNTDITVVNSLYYDGKERQIRVEYVKYYSASEGRWYEEGLANADIAPNKQHTWPNQDLAHAENDRITRWRVYFRYRESDGDWSDLYYEEINTADTICEADKNFKLIVT
ncbi:MAG: hypothetical protein ACOY0T_17200 [Myxococcota bacterium]